MKKFLNFKISLYAILLASMVPYLYLFLKIPSYDFDTVIFAIANISGFLGLVFFIYQTIIANRPFVKLFTDNIIEVNKFHKDLGILGTIFILMHPFAEMYVYAESLLFVFVPYVNSEYQTHITFGRIAFFIFLIILLTSSVFRNKLQYRNWLKTHYLSYLLVPFVYAHLNDIGTYFNSDTFINNYTLTLGVIFAIATLYRIAVYFNFNKYKYTVKNVTEYGADIVTVTLAPVNKRVNYKPGQYYYIKIEKLLGEEHPFSLLEYKENGDIVFGVKDIGKFSKKMTKLKNDQTVYIEGPYGVFTKQGQNEDPKVIIAGGIGFTPFYELIKNYTNENTFLFYCNRKIDEALNIMELKKLLNNRYFNVLDEDDTKGESIINQRLDMEVLKKYLPKKILNNTNYFLCGSPFFIKAIRELLQNNGIDSSKIFVEEFSL